MEPGTISLASPHSVRPMSTMSIREALVDKWSNSELKTEVVRVTTTVQVAHDSATSAGDRRRSPDFGYLRSSQRGQFSWTARISHHTRSGQNREALRIFEEMLEAGVQPSSYTFVAALKACSSLLDLAMAEKVHRLVVESGLETDVYVSTMLIDVYAKCGKLVAARCAFDKMTQRDVVSWNAMILAYAQREMGEEALQLYARMPFEGVLRNDRTFVAALKACSSLVTSNDHKDKAEKSSRRQRWLEQAAAIHADIVKTKFETDEFVGNMLVDVYAKCGSLEDARSVFEKMPHRSVVSWTSMILGYAQMSKGEEALHLYCRMLQQGVMPNNRTYVGVLKACSSLDEWDDSDGTVVKERCLENVRAIHSQIIKTGSKLDVFVGTMLVDVYAKCGSLVEARAIFETMPQRNVVSWNAMMSGYAQRDKAEETLQLYARMQKESVVPNEQTFAAVLKVYSNLAVVETGTSKQPLVKNRWLDQVRALHSDVVRWKLVSVLPLGNMLVDVYAKCGSLVDAKSVFDTMCSRNVVSWTVLILGYTHAGEFVKALEFFSQMQKEGVVPDEKTYIGALKACSSLASSDTGSEADRILWKEQCVEQVRGIHLQIVKRGCDQDVFVATMLVDAYAKCGSLLDARHVFDRMSHRTVASWNAMILGSAQMGEGEVPLQLYRKMQEAGVAPDDRTFLGALKACNVLVTCEAGSSADTRSLERRQEILEEVRGIHSNLVQKGFGSAVFVGTMLVDVYVKCKSLVNARQVFDTLPYRDAVCWSAMILGYAQLEEGEEALVLYARMQEEGVAPDSRAFVGALKACSGLVTSERKMQAEMRLSRTECLEHVRAIHSRVIERGCESAVPVGTMLVDAYAKCGNTADARRVFDKMSCRDATSWTAMLLGYVQMEQGEEALQLYALMIEQDVVLDARAFVGAFKACGLVAGLEKGKEVHAAMLRAGLDATESFVARSLIDMYGKCGSMIDAQQVFDGLPSREVVPWGALMAGYAHQGNSDMVFELLQRMQQEGVQPDGVIFLSVLTACTHLGLVAKGQKYFEEMCRTHGITPTIDHFTCLVDLVSRSGHLDQAMAMVRAMPFQPDSAMWRCIMSACRKWRYVELGKQAFECAIRLDESDAAAYTLMSGIYAAADMHEESKQIQNKRLCSGTKKQPGQSQWTDTCGTTHVFQAELRDHPVSHFLYSLSQDILIKVREDG